VDQETNDLKRHIENQRAALDEKLSEIESRVKSAVDIGDNYRRYPLVAAAAAFAGGLFLALIGSGRRAPQQTR
jgi:hypothetical protein